MLIISHIILIINILFFESTSFDISQIFTLALTAIITSSITWFFTRKKENSEIARNTSDSRRTDAETIILSGDKLISWIEKFEAAKTEAIEMEDEIGRLRRELDKCFDYRGNCREFLNNMKESLDEIFLTLDSHLRDFAHRDSIINELTSIREEVARKLENVVSIERHD